MGRLLTRDQFIVLGVSRTEMSDDQFRDKILKSDFLNTGDSDGEMLEDFINLLYYTQLNTSDPESYFTLEKRLNELCKVNHLPENFLFYLSTPPSLFEVIAKGLSKFNLNNDHDNTFKRLIIENLSDMT